MLPSFCNQEVIRLRPTKTKTLRGSVVPDWSEDVDQLIIGGCSVQPAATSTTTDGRVLGVSEQMTAYLPEYADVMEGDRINFEGVVYEINGKPKRWKAAANLSHIQLNLTRWEG